MIREVEKWWSAQLPGRPPDYIKGQIGGFILHKLYRGCRPYNFCYSGFHDFMIVVQKKKN